VSDVVLEIAVSGSENAGLPCTRSEERPGQVEAHRYWGAPRQADRNEAYLDGTIPNSRPAGFASNRGNNSQRSPQGSYWDNEPFSSHNPSALR
jgi:hypothetical protein